MSNVQRYAHYITEQQRKLNAAGHINEAASGEDPAITKKIGDHYGADWRSGEKPRYIGKVAGHHVYSAFHSVGRGLAQYIVHNPDGTHKSVAATFSKNKADNTDARYSKKSDSHQLDRLHPSVRHLIIKHINSNLNKPS